MVAKVNYQRLRGIILSLLLSFPLINVNAQDYLINFTGTGASNTVSSVKVDNLTQGTSLVMNGTDVLHLKANTTDIESIEEVVSGRIYFHPNPMTESSRMQFYLAEAGETEIRIYDFSSRKIIERTSDLVKGWHNYIIEGAEKGIYLVSISSGKKFHSGKLISLGSHNNDINIIYENNLPVKEKDEGDKGGTAEVVMQYNTGERLLIKGISGTNSTILTDIPTSSKIIIFNFVPCIDGDGNSYPVFQAGSEKSEADNQTVRIWMAENLRTTKFNDGKSIPEPKEDFAWIQNWGEAFCWYNNDIGNKNIYGGLYNWYAVDSKKLCPAGWHVPTNLEWSELIYTFGGFPNGFSFKETGTSHWPNPNDGTNESGFTGLPGGCRYKDSGFFSLGYQGFWFGSDDGGVSGSPVFNLTYNYPDVNMLIFDKKCAFSIRCIKN